MWNKLRSCVLWLHEPEHVARFQQYFGVLPISDQPPDLLATVNDKNLNKNNNNSNDTILTDQANRLKNGVHRRQPKESLSYDSNVLDECIEEFKHNTKGNETKEDSSSELDYRIASWFWYYFFQFGAALGNEIFYILFFPTW